MQDALNRNGELYEGVPAQVEERGGKPKALRSRPSFGNLERGLAREFSKRMVSSGVFRRNKGLAKRAELVARTRADAIREELDELVRREVQLALVRKSLAGLKAALRPTPTVLDFADAAKRLGCRRSTVEAMVRMGLVLPCWVGTGRVIAISEVDRPETAAWAQRLDRRAGSRRAAARAA